MQSITLVFLAAVIAVALAGGQYYVPRAYYTIDAEGHESAPVPLRRLRRSLNPYPYPYSGGNGANANANAEANANGSGANANANANANARANAGGWGSGGWGSSGSDGSGSGGNGGWELPASSYGSSNPNLLSGGTMRRQSGPAMGRSVSASSSVGLDSSGYGYYDQYASVYS